MKVYILEYWYSVDEARKQMETISKMLENCKAQSNEEGIKIASEMMEKHQKIIEMGGEWFATEGKTKWNEFRERAGAKVHDDPEKTYRVVLADIADDAKYWLGYKNPVEHPELLDGIQ